jgi:hypothetical protein
MSNLLKESGDGGPEQTAQNPSEMDAKFQRDVMHYYTETAEDLALRFDRGPADFHRREVLQQHVFADTGDCGAVNGGLQKDMILKMGPRGHPGGAVIWRSKKTSWADSISAGEVEIYNDALKFAVRSRILSEEIAGLRQDHLSTEHIIEGSAPPTMMEVSEALANDLSSQDGSIWDCPVREAAMRRIAGNRRAGVVAAGATPDATMTGQEAALPPTVGYNESVINMAKSGVRPASKIKGLMVLVRQLNNMCVHAAAGTIQPVYTPSEDNLSDPLASLERGIAQSWA